MTCLKRCIVPACAALTAAAIPFMPSTPPEPEPAPVREAFASVEKSLSRVKNYSAAFNVLVNSFKGDVVQTGSLAQVLPHAFLRDTHMEAMGGIMNVHELTVCDGETGWQAEQAPNGKWINAYRWTRAAMEQASGIVWAQSPLIRLTPVATNTYDGLRSEVLFTAAEPRNGGYAFTGRTRTTTPRYRAMLKEVGALGQEGFSNYVPDGITLVVNSDGIATEFVQRNPRGQVVNTMKLSSVRVNAGTDAASFTFSPPAYVKVVDMDKALIEPPHPLLGTRAPTLELQYLAGKDVTVAPGSEALIIAFFTTWSAECRAFVSELEKLYRSYGSKGIRFVTITDQQDAGIIKAFSDQLKLTLPLYIDAKRQATRACSITYVPRALIVTRDGVVTNVIGGKNEAERAELAVAAAALAR